MIATELLANDWKSGTMYKLYIIIGLSHAALLAASDADPGNEALQDEQHRYWKTLRLFDLSKPGSARWSQGPTVTLDGMRQLFEYRPEVGDGDAQRIVGYFEYDPLHHYGSWLSREEQWQHVQDFLDYPCTCEGDCCGKMHGYARRIWAGADGKLYATGQYTENI